MASPLRLNDAGTMVGKAAHGRLKSLAMAVNSNSLHFGRLMVTPSANRNSCRVAKRVGVIPRVEALRTSTLGWEIATPTELPLGAYWLI